MFITRVDTIQTKKSGTKKIGALKKSKKITQKSKKVMQFVSESMSERVAKYTNAIDEPDEKIMFVVASMDDHVEFIDSKM